MRFRLPALIALGTGGVLVVVAVLGYLRVATHLEAEAAERMEVVAGELRELMEASLSSTEEVVALEADRPELLALAQGEPGPREIGAAENAIASFMSQRGLDALRVYQVRRPEGCIVSLRRPDTEGAPDPVPGDACLESTPIPEDDFWAVSPLGFSEGKLFADVSFRIGVGDAETGTTVATLRIDQDAEDDIARLSGLIADDAEILIGTPGGIWTDLHGAWALPIDTLGLGVHRYGHPERGERLAASARIEGTPWVVWVERSVDRILSPATELRTEFILGILGALTLLVGITVAITTRFTGPLRQLTRAALAIRRGHLGRRVQSGRKDELGLLASAFDSMASSVERAHEELEDRVRARTTELEQALTDLRDLQGELVRKERLAALGELAGGVGHEIRTPLSVIQNSIYLLDRVLDDPPPKVREYLDMMATQIDKSVSIVTDLLELGRIRPPRRQRLEMAKFVAAVLNQAEIPPGIRTDIRVLENCPAAAGDFTQVGQALRNLVSNAVEAMDGHGTLTVEVVGATDGVATYVRDSGGGIEMQLGERVFEPLVTTKPRGVGLGLSLSRTLVMNNGGELKLVETGEGGTTFVLRLPPFEPVGATA